MRTLKNASYLFFVGLIVMTSVMAMAQKTEQSLSANTLNLIEWMRIIGGIVGLLGGIAGVVGVWFYFSALKKTQVSRAQTDTVRILKDQIDAQKSRIAMQDEEKATKDKMVLQLQKDAAELKARTDITKVLESQNLLLAMKKEHDTEILNIIKTAVEKGNTQYAQLNQEHTQIMEVISKLMTSLEKIGQGNLAQTVKNYDQIVVITKALDRLSHRFGVVENKMDDVVQATNDAFNYSENDRRSSEARKDFQGPERRGNNRK